MSWIPSGPALWWSFWPFEMAVLRRTYVSVLMESGAVALGSNYMTEVLVHV